MFRGTSPPARKARRDACPTNVYCFVPGNTRSGVAKSVPYQFIMLADTSEKQARGSRHRSLCGGEKNNPQEEATGYLQ